MKQIYLDYNATTPVAPSVQEAMQPFLTEHYGNPSSNHALGRAASAAIEDARSQVATLLGADRDEIVFTSGGTESSNLAILGTLLREIPSGSGHVITSKIEHPATMQPAMFLERLGIDVGSARWLESGETKSFHPRSAPGIGVVLPSRRSRR